MCFSYFDESYRFYLVNLEVVTFYAWTSQHKRATMWSFNDHIYRLISVLEIEQYRDISKEVHTLQTKSVWLRQTLFQSKSPVAAEEQEQQLKPRSVLTFLPSFVRQTTRWLRHHLFIKQQLQWTFGHWLWTHLTFHVTKATKKRTAARSSATVWCWHSKLSKEMPSTKRVLVFLLFSNENKCQNGICGIQRLRIEGFIGTFWRRRNFLESWLMLPKRCVNTAGWNGTTERWGTGGEAPLAAVVSAAGRRDCYKFPFLCRKVVDTPP